MPGTAFQLEINPRIPARLSRLEELANDLWYSWDKPTRKLFARLHSPLWQAVGHSPKAFLKRVDQRILDEAAEDPLFLAAYNRVLSAYDTYCNGPLRGQEKSPMGSNDLVAYFCAEFGFHESLPIYSGGLGILAGDHCKAASDARTPFIAMGLLYRQGYFQQTIDADGRQHALYNDACFDDLPITPVQRPGGADLIIDVEMPGRTVKVRLWQARVGHVKLFLLDTDVPHNTAHDRDIAHRLYGGDRTTRIEQEIVLGIGGVRALREMDILPTTWHINEGHAAFLVLERMRGLIPQGLDFDAALEAVASNTVFTTHTPVPAGHDRFSEQMIRHYLENCANDLRISFDRLYELGRTPNNHEFNMTALAVRCSRFQNGVSRIHGRVSGQICRELWQQVEPMENPMDYITNGVHVPTFLATEWNELLESNLGHGWSQRLTDPVHWEGIYNIPDHQFWGVRQTLKAQMLHLVRRRVAGQHLRNSGSEAHLERLLRFADPANPSVLTIGFARRFATYKRATLLFQELDWLREIVSDPERPVLFLFAGKAHPADEPGQAFMRRIAEVARMPEFEGRILLLEGYDLRLARRLVAGVDVWLNNPIFPLEASGTSGMKAAMNGVVNLSVLDGWWDEGYDGKNGWAIKPAPEHFDDARRDVEEARTLYEILQDSLLPLYYNVTQMGYSPGWVAMAKRSMATILPRFNAARMLSQYTHKFYVPASSQWRRFARDGFDNARRLADWKRRVRDAWPGVAMQRIDDPRHKVTYGETLRLEVAVRLNGLAPDDVAVELLFGRPGAPELMQKSKRYQLQHRGTLPGGEHAYALEFTPEMCGKIEYHVRAYPTHELLTHPFEMGMMVWL